MTPRTLAATPTPPRATCTMPNLLAALFLLSLLAGGITLLVRRYRRPERRLLRDFKRLRDLLLKPLLPEQRPDARRTLDACEDFLRGLILAREQFMILDRMTRDAAEITGLQHRAVAPTSLHTAQERAAEQLNAFFTQLGHIAATAGLHRESALEELRTFAEHLDDQRRALALIHRELREPLTPHDPLEQALHDLEVTQQRQP